MKLPASVFTDAGSFYINGEQNKNRQVSQRIFRAHYRLDGEGCSDLWHKLTCHIKENDSQNEVMFSTCQPSHLLWALHYMYVYCSEEVCASFFGVTAKTFRKYVWAIMSFLSTTSNVILSKPSDENLFIYGLSINLAVHVFKISLQFGYFLTTLLFF